VWVLFASAFSAEDGKKNGSVVSDRNAHMRFSVPESKETCRYLGLNIYTYGISGTHFY